MQHRQMPIQQLIHRGVRAQTPGDAAPDPTAADTPPQPAPVRWAQRPPSPTDAPADPSPDPCRHTPAPATTHSTTANSSPEPAGGNGRSGRQVVDHVLQPLGVAPEDVFFTDCLPTYFIKTGTTSQATAIREVYDPFAAAQSPLLPPADLPTRPSPPNLVRRAIAQEGPTLRKQIIQAAAPTIVTLGQEAADVLAGIAGTDRVPLALGSDYGRARALTVAGHQLRWVPLVHPGNRSNAWRRQHQRWAHTVAAAGH
jgi:uracil-DNA glycosylase